MCLVGEHREDASMPACDGRGCGMLVRRSNAVNPGYLLLCNLLHPAEGVGILLLVRLVQGAAAKVW
jgi:hypothetical protein